MRWSWLSVPLREAPLGTPPFTEREKRKVVRSESAADAPTGKAASARQAAAASKMSFVLGVVTSPVSARSPASLSVLAPGWTHHPDFGDHPELLAAAVAVLEPVDVDLRAGTLVIERLPVVGDVEVEGRQRC